MEKVNKKEIRVTYYLTNKEDDRIYKELTKNTQPGRVIKDIVAKSFENNNTTDVNLETLKIIEKLTDKIELLTDKIENLKIGQIDLSNSSYESEESNEIALTGEVKAEDLDDIDF